MATAAVFFAHKLTRMSTRIITDGSTDRVIDAPRVVLPANERLFEERASRFEALAARHVMGDFLRLMGAIARGQQAALGARAAGALAQSALDASRQYGMPPLAAQSHARGAVWRADLRDILAAAAATHDAAARTAGLEELTLEAIADRVLLGATLDDDAAHVPFVGAALQVYFTRMAAQLNAADVGSCDVATVCPVCASRPVASVIRIGGVQANLRYLICSLCTTEWNMVRVKCSACESDKGVGYLALEAAENQTDGADRGAARGAATSAEICDECHSYLKVFAQDKDPQLDAVADDLASLALDVLVDEQGYSRSGPNLLFHPGSG